MDCASNLDRIKVMVGDTITIRCQYYCASLLWHQGRDVTDVRAYVIAAQPTCAPALHGPLLSPS
jgi:hypothetical protein